MIVRWLQNGVENNVVKIFDHFLTVNLLGTKKYLSKKLQRYENKIMSLIKYYIANFRNQEYYIININI